MSKNEKPAKVKDEKPIKAKQKDDVIRIFNSDGTVNQATKENN